MFDYIQELLLQKIKKNVDKYMKLFYPVKLTTDINFYNSVFHFIVSTISKKKILYELHFLLLRITFVQKKINK